MAAQDGRVAFHTRGVVIRRVVRLSDRYTMIPADDETVDRREGRAVRDTLDMAVSLRERARMRAVIDRIVLSFAEHDSIARREFVTQLRVRDT